MDGDAVAPEGAAIRRPRHLEYIRASAIALHSQTGSEDSDAQVVLELRHSSLEKALLFGGQLPPVAPELVRLIVRWQELD
jgi:hypothetical protein